MVQPGEHLWTLRFRFLLGLTLTGEIILGLVVYRIFAYSTARAEFALTAFLLICGILALSTLQQPVARKIILGAGSFILLSLLTLLPAISGPARGTDIAGQPANTLRQFLILIALVLALVAFFGKIVTERATRAANMTYAADSWFASLAHLALAALAAVELLLQLAASNQIRLLPFNTQIYAGLSLNTVALLLLGAITAFSLLSFRSALTWLDGLMLLILGATCALFQYTFGATELVRLNPTLSSGLISNINLALSLVPLVLAVLAVFTEWARFFTPLWLAIQLLILQPFIGVGRATARAGSIIQTSQLGQIILYVLAIALVLLALRLLLYWDRRELNGIDGITIACIALAVGLIMWSAGNLLLVYLVALCALLALVLIGIHTFFSHNAIWLGRTESIIGILFTLSITVSALLLLNAPGYQGSYTTASTLNPHALNPALPRILIHNQSVLDGLFVLFLLIYILALIRQRWNRRFAHTERALLILSGFSCLLVLAGENTILSLVAANMQQLGVYVQTTFRAEGGAAIGILIASLISLLWLFRGRNRGDRILLAVLPGVAVLCVCIYYLSTSSFFLLCSLPLLTAEALIATRIERTQREYQASEAENGSEVIV